VRTLRRVKEVVIVETRDSRTPLQENLQRKKGPREELNRPQIVDHQTSVGDHHPIIVSVRASRGEWASLICGQGHDMSGVDVYQIRQADRLLLCLATCLGTGEVSATLPPFFCTVPYMRCMNNTSY
jgi:hypothetical protein